MANETRFSQKLQLRSFLMDKQHKVNTLRAYPIFLTNISADVLLELQGCLQLHDGVAVQELHQRVGAGAGRAALDPAGG